MDDSHTLHEGPPDTDQGPAVPHSTPDPLPDAVLYGDDDGDAGGAADPLAAFDEIIAREVDKGTITLVVPGRSDDDHTMSAVYDLNVDPEKFNAWVKRCRNPRDPDEFDNYRFCSLLLANLNKDLEVDGVSMGTHFRDPALHTKLGVSAAGRGHGVAVQAVRKVYGHMPDLIASAKAWMDATSDGELALGDEMSPTARRSGG